MKKTVLRKADRTVGVEYITVNPNCTVSLSKFSFFQAFAFVLIRSYQIPVLVICPLALSHFLKFKVFIICDGLDIFAIFGLSRTNLASNCLFMCKMFFADN